MRFTSTVYGPLREMEDSIKLYVSSIGGIKIPVFEDYNVFTSSIYDMVFKYFRGISICKLRAEIDSDCAHPVTESVRREITNSFETQKTYTYKDKKISWDI